MAKIRMRERSPDNTNTGIVLIKSEKSIAAHERSDKAHKKLKIAYIILGVSVLINLIQLLK